MIAAQGCFKQCFPLCTLYTNLGEEAVVHGLNQTQVQLSLLALEKFQVGTQRLDVI